MIDQQFIGRFPGCKILTIHHYQKEIKQVWSSLTTVTAQSLQQFIAPDLKIVT